MVLVQAKEEEILAKVIPQHPAMSQTASSHQNTQEHQAEATRATQTVPVVFMSRHFVYTDHRHAPHAQHGARAPNHIVQCCAQPSVQVHHLCIAGPITQHQSLHMVHQALVDPHQTTAATSGRWPISLLMQVLWQKASGLGSSPKCRAMCPCTKR
jgi:hypothetical protein